MPFIIKKIEQLNTFYYEGVMFGSHYFSNSIREAKVYQSRKEAVIDRKKLKGRLKVEEITDLLS